MEVTAYYVIITQPTHMIQLVMQPVECIRESIDNTIQMFNHTSVAWALRRKQL